MSKALILASLAACTSTSVDSTGDSDSDSDTSVFVVCDGDYPEHTVGLLQCSPEAQDGYTLFAPLNSTVVYLIDSFGDLIHSWETGHRPGNSVYLMENGHLLHTAQLAAETRFTAGGVGGIVQEFDWDGEILWEYTYASDEHQQHHDIELLPSGNILMVAWEHKTRAEAVAAGRDPSKLSNKGLWPEHVIEVDPTTDAIVWQWHLWDHVVQNYDSSKNNSGRPSGNPGKVDLNSVAATGDRAKNPDWNHINSIDYNEALDHIILSSHNQDEIWVIDHGLSTEEAATEQGDLLYRWGNPQVYDEGTEGDQQLDGQHDAQWIASGLAGAGDILVFNNGMGRSFSEILQITPPLSDDGSYELTTDSAYGPQAWTWQYKAEDPATFYSSYISGVQRLANGNTLICSGATGRFFEVTEEGQIVWEYINPVVQDAILSQGDSSSANDHGQHENAVFRAPRYTPDYPGLADRNLASQGPIEGL